MDTGPGAQLHASACLVQFLRLQSISISFIFFFLHTDKTWLANHAQDYQARFKANLHESGGSAVSNSAVSFLREVTDTDGGWMHDWASRWAVNESGFERNPEIKGKGHLRWI